jgi:hypothetical protein
MAEFMVGIGEGKLGKDWHELVLMLTQNGRLALLAEIATLFDS